MDKSLWPTVSKIDFIHSSDTWLPTILSRLSSVAWVYSKTLILLGILMQSQLREESCVSVEVEHLCREVVCKKQTSVSHSSIELGIVSLDAGVRMDGLLLDLWDVVKEVLRSPNSTKPPTYPTSGNCSRKNKSNPKPKGNRDVDQLSHVDHVTTKAHSSQGESQMYIFEDNEAVIKVIIKGRSPTMRRVSRTHRVALDWLFDRINLGTKIQTKFVDTKSQFADMLTKGNFICHEWTIFFVCWTSWISPFSCSHFISDGKQCDMSKRVRESTLKEVVGSGEAETYECGIKEPLECEERSSARVERSKRRIKNWIRVVFQLAAGNCCATTNKLQQCILKRGSKVMLNLLALGNRGGEMHLQTQHLENSAKNTEILKSGPAVNNHGWPNKGRQFFGKTEKFRTCVDWRPILVRMHRLTGHRRAHQVHHQVQHQSEVTSSHQEIGRAIPPKTPYQNFKRAINMGLRTTVCEIFQSGWRSSQRISKIQKCLHPRTFVMSQIRNGLQKWHPEESQYLYSFPKRPKLRSMLANQDDKGSLQKTHWRSSTSSRKKWWLDNSRSQSPQWGMWIKRQSPIRSRGTRSCPSLDSNLSVRNKNFFGDGKDFTKISQAVRKAKSHLHWQIIGIWKISWRCSMESSYFNTPSRRMVLPKEGYAEWKKERLLCCCNHACMKNGGLILWNAAAICEMSKTSWQMGKPLWKVMWGEPFQDPTVPLVAMVEYYPISARASPGSTNLARKFYQEYFLGMHWSRRGMWTGYSGRRHWGTE